MVQKSKSREFIMQNNASIAIIDQCRFFLEQSKKRLNKAGFKNVLLSTDPVLLESYIGKSKPFDLLVIDIHLGNCSGLDFVNRIRGFGYDGLVASVASEFSLDLINQAVLCGADDFFIKNKNFSISIESSRLIQFYRFGRNRFASQATLEDSCFLRGIGLTPFERKLINAFFPHYPSQKELADTLDRSEGYVRKTFTNIYQKFHVLNYAQLASMLTVCSRFLSSAVREDVGPLGACHDKTASL
jgi:DNA-binding NarL/FixJ family response regulator